MIGGSGAVLDVELSAKAVPESRGELWAMVRGDSGGNSEAGNPVVNEGRCTGIGGGGGDGYVGRRGREGQQDPRECVKNVAEEWECVEEEVGCGGEFWQYGKQCKSGTNGGHPEKGEAKHTGRK